MSSPFQCCCIACCESANNGPLSLVAYFQITLYEQNTTEIATLQSDYIEIIDEIKIYEGWMDIGRMCNMIA